MRSAAELSVAVRRAGWQALDRSVRPFRGKGFATRFPVLWRAHSAVRRGLGVKTVKILGHEIEVDPNDTLHIAANGKYEVVEGEWYAANVKAGDVVIEVGANIGFFTLTLARHTGPTGKVIAYEPDPELAAILRRNVARNGYQHVTVREAAVGAATETRDLFRSADNRGDNHFFRAESDAGGVSVSVCTLDDELADIDCPIDLLKMDIQGAEPMALAGAVETLKNNPPRKILIEFWPIGIVANGYEPSGVLSTLRTAGYNIAELNSTGGIVDVVDSELLARLDPTTQDWVNLVCTRSDA